MAKKNWRLQSGGSKTPNLAGQFNMSPVSFNLLIVNLIFPFFMKGFINFEDGSNHQHVFCLINGPDTFGIFQI